MEIFMKLNTTFKLSALAAALSVSATSFAGTSIGTNGDVNFVPGSNITLIGDSVVNGTLAAGDTTVGTLAAGDTTVTGTLAAGDTTVGTLAAGDTTVTGTLSIGTTNVGSAI